MDRGNLCCVGWWWACGSSVVAAWVVAGVYCVHVSPSHPHVGREAGRYASVPAGSPSLPSEGPGSGPGSTPPARGVSTREYCTFTPLSTCACLPGPFLPTGDVFRHTGATRLYCVIARPGYSIYNRIKHFTTTVKKINIEI